MPLGHLWFDFSDTLVAVNHDLHDDIKYGAFAELSGVEDTPELRQTYQKLYRQHGGSNTNIFSQEFGKSGSYWSDLVNSYATKGLYQLADPGLPVFLLQLSETVPVSVFSNVKTDTVLKSLGIDVSLFTNILSATELSRPKPHPEGYLKLIELSDLPPSQILYIGDIEEKDIVPAKSVGLKTGMMWRESNTADYNFSNFEEILYVVKTHEI